MRIDGRKNNQLRPIKFTKDYTKNALGSVLVEFGDTKVIVCANFENAIPKWMDKDSPEGWLSAEYSLLPSSTSVRCQRERTKVSGRTQEIQRLIGRSLRACLDLTKIKAAFDAAEKGKIDGIAAATLAKNMRACVSYEDILTGLGKM